MSRTTSRAAAMRGQEFKLDSLSVHDSHQEYLHSAAHTLERALKLLKAFGGEPKSLSNSDLVRKTGYSKASISRITGTLVALGYLERASDGLRFQIGVRSLVLGYNYLANSPIRKIARPIMQAFADKFDVSIALAVADGIDMLYIEYCKSPRIVALRLGVGSVLPMELTAIGRAYLWAQPSAERQRLLFEILKKAGDKASVIVTRIEAAFANLEKYGYCTSIGEYQRDSYGVGVPIFLGKPEVSMSLNCGAVTSELRESYIHETLSPHLREMAAELTKALATTDSILF